MNRQVMPLWVFVTVAAVIAVIGFGAAQLVAGSGMVIVLALTMAWIVFARFWSRRPAHG